MKFTSLLILSSLLIFSVGCSPEAAQQPASDTTSPSAETEAEPEIAAEPEAAESAEATTKSGTFVPGEAPTEGTVQVVTENGESYLELDESFKTSDQGPDLFVILHRSDDVLATTEPPAYPLEEGDYVILGPLRSSLALSAIQFLRR